MKKESGKPATADEKSIKAKKIVEISPEAAEERRLLQAFLLHQTEELRKQRNERKQKIEEASIELRNGKFISRREIKEYVTSLMQDYPSIFPNDNPFFTNMFRLHPKLKGFNPHEYKKPRLAGRLLKKLTYDLFEIDVLPALIVFAMPDGIRLAKCYRYLTQPGIDKLIQFRDQANKLMEKYNDGEWHEFYAKFSEVYRKQPRLF